MARNRNTEKKSSSADPDLNDAFAAMEEPAHYFLSSDEKDDLAQHQIPFFITRVERTNSRFGERYELYVVLPETNELGIGSDQTVILTIPVHGARDYMLNKVQEVTKRKRVGPVVLTKDDIGDGQTWLWLKRAEA